MHINTPIIHPKYTQLKKKSKKKIQVRTDQNDICIYPKRRNIKNMHTNEHTDAQNTDSPILV